MRFVLSFSGGKDSILALHHMVSQGHIPVALLVMFRGDAGRSWVHGMDRVLLNAIAEALELPLLLCEAAGETYATDMERCMEQAKAVGAEACVFGDIDIQEHRRWDEARCEATGLRALLPLWGRDRAENALEAVTLRYRCLVKCVKNGGTGRGFMRRKWRVPHRSGGRATVSPSRSGGTHRACPVGICNSRQSCGKTHIPRETMNQIEEMMTYATKRHLFQLSSGH